MSAGWQVGDMALCASVGPRYPSDVAVGSIYIVEAIWTEIPQTDTKELGTCFDLAGVPRFGNNEAYDPRRFRKIKPDTEPANADDAAWLKDLLAKPKVTAGYDLGDMRGEA